MLEITGKQLLSFNKATRARILKDIVLGLVKYKKIDETLDNEMVEKIKIIYQE